MLGIVIHVELRGKRRALTPQSFDTIARIGRGEGGNARKGGGRDCCSGAGQNGAAGGLELNDW